MKWVRDNGPWTFDGALLVLNGIKAEEEPTRVPLFEVDFWVQIHDLPVGYMTEVVGKQLGNFFGTFLQYDSKNNSSIWREYMRLRVRLDVRKSLRRRKKICKKDKTEVMVSCKYEKLGDFCFVCGVLSHTERFCQKKLEVGREEVSKEWGHWLRAQPCRAASGSRSKWLREEGDEDWGRRTSMDNHNPDNQGFQNPDLVQSSRSRRINRDNTAGFNSNTGKANISADKQFHKEGNLNFVGPDGLDMDEYYGLNLEERKRQRSEAQDTVLQTKNKTSTNMDFNLSNADCEETSPTFLAKLAAQQASQQK